MISLDPKRFIRMTPAERAALIEKLREAIKKSNEGA